MDPETQEDPGGGSAVPPRLTHYVAHGAPGYRCFEKEHQQHLNSLAAGMAAERPVPAPRRTTDLRIVDCPECWNEIWKLARAMADGENHG